MVSYKTCKSSCEDKPAIMSISNSFIIIKGQPKSLQIVQTMRERKMAAEWELDRAEANLWSLDRQYNKALKLYQKVLKNPKAVESWEEELRTLFFITYCYDKLRDERHLSEMVFRMKELAEKYQAAT